jgi:hypothetical protein
MTCFLYSPIMTEPLIEKGRGKVHFSFFLLFLGRADLLGFLL